MEKPKKTLKLKELFNNPIVGVVIVLLVNIVIAAIIVLAGRYIKIHSQYFMLGIGVLVIMALIINTLFLIGYVKQIKIFRHILIYSGVLVLLIGSVGTFYLYKTDSLINQIVNQNEAETVDYVVLSFEQGKTTDDLGDQKLGYVKGKDTSYSELLKESVRPYSRTVEYVEYATEVELLEATLEKEIHFAALPKNYRIYAENFTEDRNPFQTTTELFTFSTKVEHTISNVDVLQEPFKLLMLGINDELADSIILATFNPQTLKVTMTSLARDSFVPIACQGDQRDKLNHARGVNRQCIIDTVENFLDEKIDFYFETDFYALVKIVDALGGLEIESPVTFAGSFPLEGEYDDYGYPVYEGVTVPEGKNLLTGKQVLTFARERYAFPDSDFTRQRNQQYVIKEVATKIIATRDPNTLIKVLEGAKDNIKTNLTVNDISALMGYAIQSLDTSPLEPMDTFRIVSTQVMGQGSTRPNGASVIIPYYTEMQNVRDLIDMNVVVEPVLKNAQSFEFSYLDKYNAATDFDGYRENTGELYTGGQVDTEEPEVPEETPVEETPVENTDVTVPDFGSMTRDAILAWGAENSVDVSFGEYPTSEAQYTDGQFWSQSAGAGSVIQKGGAITITYIVKTEEEAPIIPPDEETPEEPGTDGEGGDVKPTPNP
ncbi:LCP family protein [Erysipelothrix sp. HDW6C]|uniref:LCP family protein n=1 Tax=Erysipelothrix sp. HDW6C TaxID=2714930 RepID=UPI0014078EDE|nr:LCP family protein [Erysipelothrix sp. HDW6C]QIK69383.1 LCP family protein [Erysipelothrix sp. HDW6C]